MARRPQKHGSPQVRRSESKRSGSGCSKHSCKRPSTPTLALRTIGHGIELLSFFSSYPNIRLPSEVSEYRIENQLPVVVSEGAAADVFPPDFVAGVVT